MTNDVPSIQGLHETVAAHSAEIRAIKGTLGTIQETLVSIQKDIRDTRTTPWGTLAAWAAVMVIIGASVITPLVVENTKQDTRFDKQDSKHEDLFNIVFEHVKDGHPRRVEEKARANAETIEKLNISIQREIRLLDETTETRLSHLQSTVQTELGRIEKLNKLRYATIQDKANKLAIELEQLEQRQQNHEEKIGHTGTELHIQNILKDIRDLRQKNGHAQ